MKASFLAVAVKYSAKLKRINKNYYMITEAHRILEKLHKNPRPNQESILIFESNVQFPIDNDYVDFIKNNDGAEGFLNDNIYLLLWKIDDLIALNPYYEDDDFSKQVFLIGSDGGGSAYGVKMDDLLFFKAPFLSMEEDLVFCGKSFAEFLLTIAK